MDETTVLLVIDVQVSVVNECTETGPVLERINALVQAARRRGSRVVFVQHGELEDPELRAGSEGWKLSPELVRRDDDIVVSKSYRDGFAETELDAVLRTLGARTLIVTGLQSDYCVQTTALSALSHGYDITVIEDGHTTCSAVLPTATLEASAIRAFVNSRFSTLQYPGRVVAVRSAAEVLST